MSQRSTPSFVRISLLAVACCLSACEFPALPGSGDEDDSPPDKGSVDASPEGGSVDDLPDAPALECDPWLAPANTLRGNLQVAVGTEFSQIFVVEQVDTGKIRLFERDGGVWVERKVQGSSKSIAQAPSRVSIRYANRFDEDMLLSYRTRGGELLSAAMAAFTADDDEQAEAQDLPNAVILENLEGFSLPGPASIRTIPITKSLRFYGDFGDDEHLAVLVPSQLSPDYIEGLWVGSSDNVAGPSDISVDRMKDGGSLAFHFNYHGRDAYLHLPIDDSPSLEIDGEDIDLQDLTQDAPSSDLLTPLTFRHCQQAHQGRD